MISKSFDDGSSELSLDRLAFLHIPKTAGTSLTHVLASHWSCVRIIPQHEIIDNLQENELVGINLVAGHFYAHQLGHPSLAQFAPITVLRDPMSRLFSEYRFAFTSAENSEPLTPEMKYALGVSFFEYAFSQLGAAGRHQQLFILGAVPGQAIPGVSPLGTLFISACAALNGMYVGLTENLAAFVEKLFSQVGKPAPEIPFLNTQEELLEDGLTQRQRETLREVLAADYALLDHARTLSRRWLEAESPHSARGRHLAQTRPEDTKSDLTQTLSFVRQKESPKALLESLRKTSLDIDWRRALPSPALEQLESRVLEVSSGVNEEQKHEFEFFLAKDRSDPIGALEALCSLAVKSPERRVWALSYLNSMAQQWNLIDHRFLGEERTEVLARVRLATSRLTEFLPHDRLSNIAIAKIYFYTSWNASMFSGLEFLERALRAGVSVADEYLKLLSLALESTNDPKISYMSTTLPDNLKNLVPIHWRAFQINRSVFFTSLRASDPTHVLLRHLEPNELAEDSDLAGMTNEILKFFVDKEPNIFAIFFLELSNTRSFWHSPLQKAEIARINIIEFAFSQAERISDHATLRIFVHCFAATLGTTERFWTNSEWRFMVAERMVLLSSKIPDPIAHWFKAKFFFAQENYAAVAEEYSLYSISYPNSIGPSTYIDPGQISQRLSLGERLPKGWPSKVNFIVRKNDSPQQKPTVIISANDRYLNRYAKAYAKSLERWAPNLHLHVHSFGFTENLENLLNEIEFIVPGVHLTASWEKTLIDHPYYFATGRLLRLSEWLHAFKGPMMVSDIDSPWSQSPADFFRSRMNGADVGLALNSAIVTEPYGGLPFKANRYPNFAPWVSVPAWIIALSGSDASFRFANFLHTLTRVELEAASRSSNPNGNWTIDQNILLAAYLHSVKHFPDIQFADISSAGAGRGVHWIVPSNSDIALKNARV